MRACWRLTAAGVQDDVAVRVASQGDGVALQGEDVSGRRPLEGLQHGHRIARGDCGVSLGIGINAAPQPDSRWRAAGPSIAPEMPADALDARPIRTYLLGD